MKTLVATPFPYKYTQQQFSSPHTQSVPLPQPPSTRPPCTSLRASSSVSAKDLHRTAPSCEPPRDNGCLLLLADARSPAFRPSRAQGCATALPCTKPDMHANLAGLSTSKPQAPAPRNPVELLPRLLPPALVARQTQSSSACPLFVVLLPQVPIHNPIATSIFPPSTTLLTSTFSNTLTALYLCRKALQCEVSPNPVNDPGGNHNI